MRSSALGELIAAGTKQSLQNTIVNTDMELDQSDEEEGDAKSGKPKNETINRIIADNDKKREQWSSKKGGQKGGKNWRSCGKNNWQSNRNKNDSSSSGQGRWQSNSNWNTSNQKEDEKEQDNTPKNPMKKKKEAPIGSQFKEKGENFLKTAQGWIYTDGDKKGQIWVQK